MQIPKPTDGGTFEPAPAGTFIATCYRFLDRGTQMTEFNGERKTRREVMISWEIADEFMSDGRPFTATKTYTWSMHEKAGLRKDLESWRGRAFTDDDFDGPHAFNTKNLLGKSCMLTVTHETKGEKTYSKIASVGKLMKGVTPPALVNSIVYLALTKEGWDASVYGGLSDKMKQTISASPEYKELMQSARHHDDPGAYAGGHDDSDPIPF